ncbi:SRPBCC family protein [Actinoalloteichus spitiensis]|uniref:SRPBCC family protein n=1 Tax=Actinoalloteichus spitiensis TaxID=252394 RepID=UPI00035F14BB|nr:SRPBCC family protein [Actinoalloteichus spitiensis]
MSERADELRVTTPSDVEITMSRTFDAPRDRLFAAYASREHLRRWWARGNPMDCELDFRPGGSYRFVEHAPDGDYAFHGEYQEITAPERIVHTFEFEGTPGEVLVDTVTFEERDGRTTLTTVTRFDSREARDAMLRAGMVGGAAESLRRLAEILPTLP